MTTEKKDGIFKRFKAKTPPKNKQRGIIWTAVGGLLGVFAIAVGVTAPLGMVLLASSGFAGTMATIHGQKVQK